jgi:uncharacterized membrane protein
MLFLILFSIAAQVLILGLSIRYGDRVIRLAAIWIAANVLLHMALSLGRLGSATLHLVADGIYATGLLPLAFFSVSPWIGAQALLACGSFVLQSYYLLSDRPTDPTFAYINDAIMIGYLLTFLAGTAASVMERRRAQPAAARSGLATA